VQDGRDRRVRPPWQLGRERREHDGNIEFGCGSASIDSFTFSSATTFTATGTQTAGSGVQFPPGMGPQPQPATFTGHLAGNTLTLEMTVGANTSTLVFTTDRQINLFRCL
jgi:hypothetical protein